MRLSVKNITILAIASLSLLCSCKSSTKALLPNVSGKAGEVIVVMGKGDWEGNLGTQTRDLLACDCPWLAQKEPLYTLVNVFPSGFADLFKIHRNIVIFNIDPQVAKEGVSYRHDVWSQPQCVIEVAAASNERAQTLLSENGANIVNAIEQAERDRVIANTIRYEEKGVADQVAAVFGGSPHFPTGYKLKKITSDFAWVSYDKQYSMQGIFVYSYPANGTADDFSVETIVTRRNEVLKENVPGMFDHTYMTTSEYILPSVEFVRYKDRQFANTRGFWEVYNDYMGGPFVSHSFYTPDGSSVLVIEAFVYAPKYNKRQFLRQVESVLYSFGWKNIEDSSK